MSLYDYCSGDPVNRVDPDGRKVQFSDGVNPLNYALAKGYLSVDPTMKANFDKLENSATVYTITINHNDDDHYSPSTNEIAWDPNSALKTTEGGEQSPALGLGHEVDHAVNSNSFLTGIQDPDYGNWEEMRVITGSETTAANALGEDVRHDHSGSTYKVDGPLALNPSKPSPICKK